MSANSRLLPTVTVGLLVILAAVTGMVYTGFNTNTTPGTTSEIKKITVTGIGEVKTVPDRTRIFLAIVTQGKTAEEASSLNADIFQKFSAALSQAGVTRDRLETQSYNINPIYDYPEKGRPVLIGYEARHRLLVTVVPKNIDDLGKESGKVIDIIVAQGVNQIEYIEFTVASETRSKLKDDALKAALTSAQSKAELMAQSLGVKITGVQSVFEAGFIEPPSPVVRGSVAEVKAATEVVPGTVTVSTSVTVVYALG
ncbi:MAG: SIMPL domain-containing protein [Thaumarchaeota archaeon]|nr:SIMPL domain-containing protein [Nitrososphaerota archaeon]